MVGGTQVASDFTKKLAVKINASCSERVVDIERFDQSLIWYRSAFEVRILEKGSR